MRLGLWHSRPQQTEPAASRLVPALDRVREMREQAAWEPITAASNIRERAERVSLARRNIAIPALAGKSYETEKQLTSIVWFHEALGAFFLVVAGALVVLLVWLTMFAD